jgi:hypothetical protein
MLASKASSSTFIKRQNEDSTQRGRRKAELLAIRKRGGGLSGYGQAKEETAGTEEERKVGEEAVEQRRGEREQRGAGGVLAERDGRGEGREGGKVDDAHGWWHARRKRRRTEAAEACLANHAVKE